MMMNQRISLFLLFFLLHSLVNAQVMNNPFLEMKDNGQLQLTEKGAAHFARLALDCMQREYPNKLNQVLKTEGDLGTPKNLHPAFYGCFDWHSSVHGHWMLVHLLRRFPNLTDAAEIRKKLEENLTAANLAGEVAYLKTASKSWERMYGWSWLMKLSEELYLWKDPDAQAWSKNMQPLTDLVIERYQQFLPIQTYPVRTGVHPNTAFGLSFAYDYAQSTGNGDLGQLIAQRAKDYYLADTNCPASWEPSGEDFLSACLEEANLMHRILPPLVFREWFDKFLPAKQMNAIASPADVSDRADPKIVHLDGLNLSRAWCLYSILPSIQDDQKRQVMLDAASKHLLATIPNIASEHYEGGHWLASFAVYALSVN